MYKALKYKLIIYCSNLDMYVIWSFQMYEYLCENDKEWITQAHVDKITELKQYYQQIIGVKIGR